MQQDSNDPSQPQWRKLTDNINGNKPTGGDQKLLISQDHLIVLTSDGNVVYTFHLKDLSWTKHDVERRSTRSMSSNSCMAKSGLIVDLSLRSSPSTVELLTFDPSNAPTNFCQTSKNLRNSPLDGIQGFTISADPTSIYLFGGKHMKQSRALNTLYQVNIESCEVIALSVNGPIPCERSEHVATLHQDKLFVFGGKNNNSSSLSDLWVFNLSEKKWKQLNNSCNSRPESPSFLFAQDDQLVLCNHASDGIYSTWSFIFNESSWKLINSSSPKSYQIKFAVCENSLLALESSQLYSLNVSNKMKRCSEKQPENFMIKMFQDKTFADVIFQVEDQEFPANKCFLSVRCPYFKNVFTSNMMESQSKVIPVKDERAEVFKVMLEYLYFIEVEVGCEIAEDLFKLSHKYRLENLKNDCEELLTKDIKVDNVIKRIHLAKLYEASKLRKACLVFIVRNLDQVFLTQNIHELDKETLLELHKIKV